MARDEAWATEVLLGKDTIEKSPRNGRALFSYGLSQMTLGNYAVAKVYYERAERMNPDYPPLEINLGIVEGALSHEAAAERHFKRAQALSNDVDAHYYYGRWLISAGRTPDAISELNAASQIDAARPEPRTLLMKVYAAAGNSSEVERLAHVALSYDPPDFDAFTGLTRS